MLRGKLSYRDISHIFQYVDANRSSGVLTVRSAQDSDNPSDEHKACFYFDHGKLVLAESNQVEIRMGDLLLQRGVVTEAQIEKALELQRSEEGARRLGTVLCSEFRVDRDQIEDALSQLYATIAADVFQWESGEFLFEVSDQLAQCDLFCLIPSEFILEAGLDAGVLAINGDAEQE